MTENKFRCTKCGAMEVILVKQSADPFGLKPSKFVCQKCGNEYDADSGIGVINNKTINSFPSPSNDLNVDDPLTERIKSKRKTD